MVTIQKRKSREGNKVQVTFTMPARDDCDCLYLVGRFSSWNESVYRMQRMDDGTWRVTLELESGHKYRYRFRTDHGEWLKDPCASEISLDCTSAAVLIDGLKGTPCERQDKK